MASKQQFFKALIYIAYERPGSGAVEAKIKRATQLWRYELTPEQRADVQAENERARIWAAAWQAAWSCIITPDAVPPGEQP